MTAAHAANVEDGFLRFKHLEIELLFIAGESLLILMEVLPIHGKVYVVFPMLSVSTFDGSPFTTTWMAITDRINTLSRLNIVPLIWMETRKFKLAIHDTFVHPSGVEASVVFVQNVLLIFRELVVEWASILNVID